MNIKLITIGKTTDSFLQEGIKVYKQRLKHYISFEIVELPDVKATAKDNIPILLKKEEDLIMKQLVNGGELVLLDESGKQFDSIGFSSFVEKKILYGTKHLLFVVGGAYGFSDNIKRTAKEMISLSSMTFTHQMVRLFFVEQLYRAFTIINKHPYHNS